MKNQLVKQIESKEMQQQKTTEIVFNNQLVNRWLKFAAVSEKSIATYSNNLKQLFLYFSEKNISVPTREDLENYRDMLIDSGKAASTVALYMTATKLFFRFLAQEGIFPNIADHIKNRVRVSTNHKKDSISIQQANNLLKAVSGDKLKNLRDKAIVALMLSTGIRSIEVVRADICDIRQIEGRYFLFVQGKGRSEKAEMVEIAPNVMKAINSYLKAREKAAGKKTGRQSPLFVSTAHRNFGCRLDTRTIRGMVKGGLRQIGIDSPTVTCHSLRHFAASTMVMKKVELPNIQQALRHKNLATTMIYLNYFSRIKNRAENIVAQVLKI